MNIFSLKQKSLIIWAFIRCYIFKKLGSFSYLKTWNILRYLIFDFVQSKDLWVILPVVLMTLTSSRLVVIMIQAGDLAARCCILNSLPNKNTQRKWINIFNEKIYWNLYLLVFLSFIRRMVERGICWRMCIWQAFVA